MRHDVPETAAWSDPGSETGSTVGQGGLKRDGRCPWIDAGCRREEEGIRIIRKELILSDGKRPRMILPLLTSRKDGSSAVQGANLP